MEMLAIFLVMAAVRGLIQQTKRDLDKWKKRPAKPRGPGWWRAITAAGTGYWGNQAVHGFPTARHGAAAGYHRARKAHQDAQHGRERARTEADEHKARTRPEIDGFKARRRAALELLEQQQAEREQQEHEDYLALIERRRLREEARQRRERERAEAERAAGAHRTCSEHGNLLPCDACEVDAGRGDDLEDEEPDEYDVEAQAIRDEFEYENCEICGKDLDRHRIARDPLGHAHAYCLDDPADGDEKPEDPAAGWDDPLPGETPAPETSRGETTKGNTMGEVTYASVKAKMQQTVTDAEMRQSEAAQSVAATEEHLTWTQAAKSEASTMADEMQALEVDSATLGAMAEHLEALDAAEKAAVDLRDQAVLNKAAWDRVLESAQQVVTQLEASGHGAVDEAHAAAAGGGAQKDFYGE